MSLIPFQTNIFSTNEMYHKQNWHNTKIESTAHEEKVYCLSWNAFNSANNQTWKCIFLRREITLEIMYNQTPSRSKYCCILLRYYANLTCGISYSLINSFHNSVNNALISYHAPVFCPSITVVHCFAKPALPIIINILAKYREINLINKIGLGDRALKLEEEVFMETM